MRTGRSLLRECCAILRYRRALVKLRAVAMLVTGTALCLGAATEMLVGPFDGPLFCVLFIVMLWGAFGAAWGTWELL